MRRASRVAIGAALAVAAVVAMGGLSRLQHTAEPERAELRLAWRTAVPRVVECREPTEEELRELPVHMRQDEICEGRAVRYRLEVRVDGELRHASTEGAAGVRGDRPLHVFEELPLEPGTRHVRIVFERADGTEPGAGDDGSAPARVVLDRRFHLGVRDVLLVTYDAGERQLVTRDRPEV